jgi:hypothetical protein
MCGWNGADAAKALAGEEISYSVGYGPRTRASGAPAELADIRLLDVRQALGRYPQRESGSSGHGWLEEPGTLASSLGLLAELAEVSESLAGAGPCLSPVSS